MKNILKYITQGLVLLFMVPALMLMVACGDENLSSTNEVQLLSFGPSGVKHGDEIVFIGNNLDKISSIMFKPQVEITKDAFTLQTSGQIKMNVPDEAEAGHVVLKTTAGDTILSKSILNFDVPVKISGFTAEAKPGTNITITGDKLNWIEQVTFPADLIIEKKDFVSQSLKELVVTVPMEAQTGYLLFASGGTEPMTFGTESQLTVTLPAVTGLSPSSIRHTADLSIKGSDLDLVTEVVFFEDISVTKDKFKSQSSSEIVVAVPADVEKGTITLKQMSPVDVVTTDELTIILPKATAVTPSPAVPGTDVMVITGTDLDLVAQIVLPTTGSVTDFLTHTETEISFNIPESATQGAIGYVTIHGYEGPLEGALLKLPPTGGFPTLDYYIYSDGFQNGWEAWGGWGHVSQDFNNTENPANGELAIKTVFNDSYGAIQLHNSGATNVFDGYNYLVFYVFVQGEESDIIAQIDNNTDYYPAHFTGDKYHQIVVPLADLAGADNVSELRIKNNNPDSPTNNTTVYVDEIGLTVDEPLGLLPDLITVIFDDALQSPFGVGGGWGGTSSDVANEENSRGGSVSVKATFVGGWGGACQFGSWGDTPLTTASMQYFAFSIYGEAGTDGKSIQLNIKSNTDGTGTSGSAQVTINEGKWTDYAISLSDLGDPPSIGEISFQDTDWSGTVFIDHMGLQ